MSLELEFVLKDGATVGIKRLQKELGLLDPKIKKVDNSMNLMNSSVAKLAIGYISLQGAMNLGGSLVRQADEFKLMNSQLKLVTNSTVELTRVQKELFSLAQETRQDLGATTNLYARLARASQDLGTSQEDLLKVTSTINKALIVSGASTQEASSAITQLSQGLASGVLRGEEFNSITENGSRIARALADSLGVTIGQLRDMSQEGKLTSKVVMDALKGQSDTISKEYDKMEATIGQSMVNVSNSILKTVGSLDKATGASKGFASELKGFSTILDDNQDNIQHFSMFTIATVGRMIDGFDLLQESAELGIESLISVPQIGLQKFIATLYEQIADLKMLANDIADKTPFMDKAFSDSDIQETLLGANLALEKSRVLVSDLKVESKEVSEAFNGWNTTVEERIALSYKEIEAQKLLGQEIKNNSESGNTPKELTSEELKALQKQLELNEKLNDTYISITGSEYDAWANETSNKMIAMAESTSITTEELKKYHEALLKTNPEDAQFEADWIASENEDLQTQIDLKKEKAQLEKDWADLQQENYMSMLDSQISLVNSTNDWNTALGDTLNSVGDISNSFSKLYSDNLKSEKEQFKLKIKYEKDLEKYGSDPSKKLKLDKAYAKDSDKIKNNSFKNELAGYADLTSGVKGMLDEKTGAYRALEAIETGMHVARLTMGAIELASTISNATASAAASSVAITAKMGEAAANATASVTAAGSGDPYTAPARVAIMVGLMAAAMTMFGGSGGGGVAGSVTAPTPPRSEEYYNDARDLAEETNKPILAKFDRQIELLEEISGYGGTTIGFSLDQALAEYTAQSQLDIINASEQGQKTNISTWSAGWEQWHVDPLSANKARLEALAGDFVENIDAWIKIIATDETHRYASGIAIDEGSFSNASEFVDFLEYLKGNNLLDEFGYTQLEYENILSDFQNATNEFVTSILSDVNTLTDFADELKGSYDEMSGTTKYEDIALSKAYEDVNSLVGGSTLSDYIELQIRNIDALENSLSDADISLLLSSSVEDFQEQQELVARIQKDALVTLDSGVLEALNYKDSILLVSEAMVESAESLRDFQDNIESMINGIDNAINSIRGNTMTNEELSEEEIKRLNLTQRAFEASLAESDTDKAQELLSEITSLSTSISNSAFGDTSLLDQNLISNLEATKALISFEDEVINVNIVSSELTTPVSTDTYAPSVTVSNPTNDSERLDNLEAIMTQVLITNRNVYDLLQRLENDGLKAL